MGIWSRRRDRVGGTPTNGPRAEPATDLFRLEYTSDGAMFWSTAPAEVTADFSAVSFDLRDQMIALDMLVEAGHAAKVEGGYFVDAEALTNLDSEFANVLRVPPPFQGGIRLRTEGNTTTDRFSVQLEVTLDRHPEAFTLVGPVVRVGYGTLTTDYLLNLPLMRALDAVDAFNRLEHPTENQRVKLVAALQAAQQDAQSVAPLFSDDNEPCSEPRPVHFPIDLGHFKKFTTHTPEKIGLTLTPQDGGATLVTPNFGTEHDPDFIDKRLKQLDDSADVLRLDDTIIPLSENQARGVKAIHQRRTVREQDRERMLRAPGEFFGPDAAEAVDFEEFSARVRAIGRLEPVSFAQASDTGLQWISESRELLQPSSLPSLLETPDDLAEAEAAIETARDRGQQTIPLGGSAEHVLDISDAPAVDRALEQTRHKFQALPSADHEKPDDAVQVGMLIDESLTTGTLPEDGIPAVRPTDPFDRSGLAFSLFEHQEEGINWITGMMEASLTGPFESPERIQGGILADDMGLGKTFMTLVALREFNRLQRARGENRPHLLVLPLSLIENWKREMSDAFDQSPFGDVVQLQGEGLRQFKLGNARRESEASASQLNADDTLDPEHWRFSLAVGSEWPHHARLDTPGRVVITTYETLASYQLSLGRVQWGAVIFDEAQEVKNPETLRTRAAKGLQARFKLVATGTPVENSLRDLWNLMDLAQPGHLGTWAAFRETWVKPLKDGSLAARENNGRRLRRAVGEFMLRRTKEDHLKELPRKTIYSGNRVTVNATYREDLRVLMGGRQSSVYESELAAHRARSGTGKTLETINRLKAVSLHADAADRTIQAQDWRDGGRFLAVFNILDGVREAEEKAIVFVKNKSIQRRLVHWIAERYAVHADIVNGDTSTGGNGRQTRMGMIETFQGRPGFNVIVMSPLAAGRGLTVTEANHAIHLERHWNPAKEAQATDRIYRIGQRRPVHVYLPMAIHPDDNISSFDDTLDGLLNSKTELKDAVVVPAEVSHQDVAAKMNLN